MKLADFGWVVDENLDPLVVQALRNRGLRVVDVCEQGWQSLDDTEILQNATNLNCLVVTQDSDFGKLTVLQKLPLIGIVFLRPGHLTTPFILELLDFLFLQDPELESPFIVVAKRSKDIFSVRVRQWTP